MVVLDAAAVLMDRAPAKLGRGLLTLLASVLYGLGWTAARTVALTVAAARSMASAAIWSASMVKFGWHEAHQPRAR